MLKFKLTTLILLCSIFSYCQTPKLDSLKIVLKNTINDSTKMNLLNQLSGESFGVDHKACEKFCNELLKLSIELNEHNFQASALNTLGGLSWYKADYNAMDSLYQMALGAYQKAENNKGIIMAMGNLAISASSQQNYSLTIERLEEAIDFAEMNGDSLQTGNLRANLGRTYRLLGFYEKATHELLRSIEVYDLINRRKEKGNTYKALGDVFLNMKNFQKAKEYYMLSLKIFEEEKYVIGLINTYNSIGVLLSDSENDYLGAIDYFIKSKSLADSSYNKSTLALVKQNIGLQYFFLKEYSKAKEYYQESLELFQELENSNGELKSEFGIAFSKIPLNEDYENILISVKKNEQELDLRHNNNDEYGYLAMAFAEIQDFENAYTYLLDYTEMRDTIFQKDVQNTISSLEGLYQSEKKSKEIAEQKLTIESQNRETSKAKRERNYFALGGILLLIVSGIFWYLRRKLNQQNKEISNLYKELHHRSKNNFSTIRTLANSYFSGEGKKAQESLEQLNNSIDSLVSLHQMMYQNEEIAAVDFENFGNNIFDRVNESFGREGTIKMDSKISPDPNKSSFLGLIINEMMTNSFKHAETKGELKAELNAKVKNKEYIIEYSDNGNGIDRRKKGFGLKMIEGLANQLNGSFEILKRNDRDYQTLKIPV